MSTEFITKERVKYSDLFDGRLEKLNIREYISPQDTSEYSRALTDGQNYLWTHGHPEGVLFRMCRYGDNKVQKILQAIADTFEVEIYSEHDEEYWEIFTEGDRYIVVGTVSSSESKVHDEIPF
jgi:hypothetical protein